MLSNATARAWCEAHGSPTHCPQDTHALQSYRTPKGQRGVQLSKGVLDVHNLGGSVRGGGVNVNVN
jgi:hypothetical protein